MVEGRGIEPAPATVISCNSGSIRPSRTPVRPSVHLVRSARFELARPFGQELLRLPRLPIPAMTANLAEKVGFEPTAPLRVRSLSRRVVSTTHALLRIWRKGQESNPQAGLPRLDAFKASGLSNVPTLPKWRRVWDSNPRFPVKG